MKKLKKYLPVIFLLLFVALVIIALIIANGIARRGAITPNAPTSRPAAASCLLSFDIPALSCGGVCTTGTAVDQCAADMTCFSTSGTPGGSGVCRNVACTDAADCVCPSATPTATPSATPTATPSATPTATPSGTPTPGCNSECVTASDCPSDMTCNTDGFCRNPNNLSSTTCENVVQGGFFIRKYNDTNGNGKQDTSEKGLSWKFQWTKDNGVTWNDYDTDGTKLGEGGVITLPVGTSVEIKEVAQSGWTSTTPTDVKITITQGNNQLMVFGNWQPTTATATPTAAPQCGSTCVSNGDCPSSMNCVAGACRNPSCTDSTSCVCQVAQNPTPTPPTEVLPKTGAVEDTLKLVGAGVGAVILGLVGLLAL